MSHRNDYEYDCDCYDANDCECDDCECMDEHGPIRHHTSSYRNPSDKHHSHMPTPMEMYANMKLAEEIKRSTEAKIKAADNDRSYSAGNYPSGTGRMWLFKGIVLFMLAVLIFFIKIIIENLYEGDIYPIPLLIFVGILMIFEAVFLFKLFIRPFIQKFTAKGTNNPTSSSVNNNSTMSDAEWFDSVNKMSNEEIDRMVNAEVQKRREANGYVYQPPQQKDTMSDAEWVEMINKMTAEEIDEMVAAAVEKRRQMNK